ncbi:MAG: HAD family phosphatase [Desulfomonile tiedjei]|nr:HAD family phosphatase [Desulfomonile tiedjei]
MNQGPDEQARLEFEQKNDPIEVVAFDFGGVLAEEGFRKGLKAIARLNGLDEQQFFELATATVYDTGYVVGKADENFFWQALRERTGIRGSDEELRGEILDRFILRPWIFNIVRTLRSKGYVVVILSDQTQWLDVLDQQHDFFKEFNRVFNSYHMGKGKKNPEIFRDVSAQLGTSPSRVLFIDDNLGNVERARSEGFSAIHFKDRESLEQEMKKLGLL